MTTKHYSANGNFDHGAFNAPGDPGSDGFNVADVSSVSAANALPAGDQGLIYWGQTTGVTAAFKAMVTAAHADPHVLGFYVADEPSDDAATLANIKAEVQYINAHDGAKLAFI